MNRGDAWREKGTWFSWAPRSGDADEVQIFHVELGDADAPPLVLVHGFPTSSVDWFEVATQLSDRYRVCAMDFPGFGFSGPSSSGNQAFDEYRMETLRRLEEEQQEFRDFLARLRHAKDKEEFDAFMAQHKPRPTPPTDQPQQG